jgi:hypothetical protein
MTTFLASFMFSSLLMVDVHLTLILLTLILIAVILFFRKNAILEFFDDFSIEDFSLLKLSLGFLSPLIIAITISIITEPRSYSPKDFPSVKCELLIQENGITSLKKCSDKKTYINTQVIGE